MKKIILASASPRRADLLRSLGVDFDVLVTDADETVGDVSAAEAVAIIAGRKAEAASAVCADRIVVAADTVVAAPDGEILGKPKDADDARRMLGLLSGKTHTVYTCVCVAGGGRIYSETVAADVAMYELDGRAVENYILTGEPFDKAGAYGIQSLGGVFVRSISGDYFNVTGMPKAATARLLYLAGVDVIAEAADKT